MNKVFKTLGASNHLAEGQEREKNDFYATPTIAVVKMLDKLNELGIKLPNLIIEPSVGTGKIANALIERGHNICAFDIVDRGFPNTNVTDFLSVENLPNEPKAIIANFPYKDIVEHTIHALNLLNDNEYLISLTKIQFLESKKRYEKIFKENPPMYCLIFSERITCNKNDIDNDYTGAMCYMWSIFKKGFKGNPIIDWITGSNK